MNEIKIKTVRAYRPNKFLKAYWGFRNWFRDVIFEPIWYRIFGHKFHIIRTGLKPSPWYDADTRILYGVMSSVLWFVENDMRLISKEDYEKEIERINGEETEHKESFLETWKDQYETELKIQSIYAWWKAYPKRQEEIQKSLNEWHDYSMKLKEDPEDFFSDQKCTKKEAKEEKRLLDYHWKLEKKLQDEEQEYLKLAIDLRNSMWS